jgi:hypothetical protein
VVIALSAALNPSAMSAMQTAAVFEGAVVDAITDIPVAAAQVTLARGTAPLPDEEFASRLNVS